MLTDLFFPGSVAVLGATATPDTIGHTILANLLAGSFSGPIVVVSPDEKEILGLACHATLKEYGQNIDLAIITLARDEVEKAVKESVAAGCKAIVVVSSGFKEQDEAGAVLEAKLADYCQRRHVRLLGPNCMGIVNTATGLNASSAVSMPGQGAISIISQSGALLNAFLDLVVQRHLGLAQVASLGNKADISEIDLLHHLARQDETKVIIGYLEDISDGDEFIKAAEEASNQKPVILFKAGITEAGRQAAASHTGVLSARDTAYGAAFRQTGVIRADSFAALLDYGMAFATQSLPTGNRVAIITNAIGPGIMALDALDEHGLVPAEPDHIQAGLTPLRTSMAGPDLPATTNNESLSLRHGQFGALWRLSYKKSGENVDQPVMTVLGDCPPSRFAEAIQQAQTNADVDGIIVILTPQANSQPAETAQTIAGVVDNSKPLLLSFMGGESVAPACQTLAAAGLPHYPSPEQAVAALKAMYDYHCWRNRPPRIVNRFRVNRRRVERTITRSIRSRRLQLSEVKAKAILRAYGFRVPKGQVAINREEAVEIADQIGYPVALKIVSPDIIHKSDLGGVKLNLTGVEDVRDGFDLMNIRIRERVPQAHIEGIYVEQMAKPGLEVILGMNRDPQFGPMLMFGLGGIFVEVMEDVAFHLAPITFDEAMQMLLATRSYAMLQGKRGQHEVDIEAIATGLQRLSQLTTDFPQITELDINPFIIDDIGSEPVVADARITLGQ